MQPVLMAMATVYGSPNHCTPSFTIRAPNVAGPLAGAVILKRSSAVAPGATSAQRNARASARPLAYPPHWNWLQVTLLLASAPRRTTLPAPQVLLPLLSTRTTTSRVSPATRLVGTLLSASRMSASSAAAADPQR